LISLHKSEELIQITSLRLCPVEDNMYVTDTPVQLFFRYLLDDCRTQCKTVKTCVKWLVFWKVSKAVIFSGAETETA